MRAELTLTHGLLSGTAKGLPQSWIIHPRSFCLNVRSMAQNGIPLLSRSILKLRPSVFLQNLRDIRTSLPMPK
jgi:hypothetical protein